jgi:hypothetical protein
MSSTQTLASRRGEQASERKSLEEAVIFGPCPGAETQCARGQLGGCTLGDFPDYTWWLPVLLMYQRLIDWVQQVQGSAGCMPGGMYALNLSQPPSFLAAATPHHWFPPTSTSGQGLNGSKSLPWAGGEALSWSASCSLHRQSSSSWVRRALSTWVCGVGAMCRGRESASMCVASR